MDSRSKNKRMGTKIYGLIPKVSSEVGGIAKTGFNLEGNFGFHKVDEILAAIQPVFAKYKIFTVPTVLESFEEKFQSANKENMTRIKLKVFYKIFTDDGSFIEATVPGEAIDESHRSVSSKAMTDAFKTVLRQVFSLSVKTPDVDSRKSSDSRPAPTPLPVKSARELGEYVVTMGDFSGEKLKDIHEETLIGLLNNIKSAAKQKRFKLEGKELEHAQAIADYLTALKEEES